MMNTVSVRKQHQILLVVVYHILKEGASAGKVNFTVRTIADKYGKEFVDWETDKSSIAKLLSAGFNALEAVGHIKVIGTDDSGSNIYRITSENPVELFHQLIDKIKYNGQSKKNVILSEALKTKLILYNDEDIFEPSEGHYKILDGIQAMLRVQKLLNMR